MMASDHVEIDPIAESLATMPYGLYIVGSRDDGDLNGMMADWLMQVSFRPRLVACSFENDATTLRNIRNTRVFSVNLLRAGSRVLAARFAQPRDASKIEGRSEDASAVVYRKLEGVDYDRGDRTGCPILADALAWLECEAVQFIDAGDHTLVVGRVQAGAVRGEGEPLTQRMLGWSYAG